MIKEVTKFDIFLVIIFQQFELNIQKLVYPLCIYIIMYYEKCHRKIKIQKKYI